MKRPPITAGDFSECVNKLHHESQLLYFTTCAR